MELDDKRVQMVVTISPETRDRLKAIAGQRGMTPGRFIDSILKDYEKE